MAWLFGLFDHSRPGKGVSKDESRDGRLRFFFQLTGRKFGRLVQLNLLYLLCCLPVVTIGPATAALCHLLRQLVDEKPIFLLSDFWESLKANCKQSLLYGVLSSFLGAVAVFSFRFYWLGQPEHPWMLLPLAFCFAAALLLLVASLYIYLMIVTLDLGLIPIMKNGVLLAILCVRANLVTLLALMVALFVLVGFRPLTLPLFALFGCSFLWMIAVYNVWPEIRRYVIDPGSELRDDEKTADRLFQDEPKNDRSR